MIEFDIQLNLARCHFPVNGLGFGRRVGIWLQGCSIHCAGCIVPETWVAERYHRTSLRVLLGRLQPWLDQADGVTISGGEPFDQSDALHALLAALRTLTQGDILVYSGYPWRVLTAKHSQVLESCDVVISEPFKMSERGDEPIVGSRNQKVHTLTALGHDRYENWREFKRRIDVANDGGIIRLSGIPKPGQLQLLCDDLNRQNFEVSLTHAPV